MAGEMEAGVKCALLLAKREEIVKTKWWVDYASRIDETDGGSSFAHVNRHDTCQH